MRQKRELAENVWYGVGTAINVGETLFRQDTGVINGSGLADFCAHPPAEKTAL
jgi:hypothetical protein